MIFAFEDYLLNTDTAQLTHSGVEITLEPRALGLLVLLVENHQRVVSKDEIVAHLWNGRFTSDAAISTCVKTLRKALQDTGDQQQFVRTLWGRGFRFVAEVTETSAPAAKVTPPANPLLEPTAVDSLSLQGKPSLVVLPLRCLMSGEGDTVLAEGMAHELIQALARLRWLRVIARGTAFQFSPNADLRQVGSQLSVRYALCGSMETLPDGWAITVELSNCSTADVLWAERYQVRSDSLHEVRQHIVANVIAAMETYIPQQEASQASLHSTEHMDAWANYHLGLRHMYRFTVDDNARAKTFFERAVELDAGFARAWGGLSFTRFQDAFVNYDRNVHTAIADARRFAETSVELDPLDPFVNFNMGRSFWLEGDVSGGFSWLERSVALSPNFAQGHYSCAFSEVLQGDVQQALLDSEKAISLSPLDPLLYAIYGVTSFSYLMRDDMVQACQYADKAARAPGAHFLIHMIAAAVFALAGDSAAAKYWHNRARKLNPDACANHFFAAFPFVDSNVRGKLLKGLKQAGF